MKLRMRKHKVKERKDGYWPSFVDGMTAITLVFFFIMVLVIGMNVVFSDDIAKERLQLYNKIEHAIISNGVNKNVMEFNKMAGKIEIYSETTFEKNKYNLKNEGKEIAKMLGKIFLSLFNNEDIVDKVQYIEVVGHTDFSGTTQHGRTLSVNRAVAFLMEMVPINSELEKKYGNKFKASGMSEFESYVEYDKKTGDILNKDVWKSVIQKKENSYNENTEANKKARKIEIRIIFNTEDIDSAVRKKVEAEIKRGEEK